MVSFILPQALSRNLCSRAHSPLDRHRLPTDPNLCCKMLDHDRVAAGAQGGVFDCRFDGKVNATPKVNFVPRTETLSLLPLVVRNVENDLCFAPPLHLDALRGGL